MKSRAITFFVILVVGAAIWQLTLYLYFKTSQGWWNALALMGQVVTARNAVAWDVGWDVKYSASVTHRASEIPNRPWWIIGLSMFLYFMLAYLSCVLFVQLA